MSLFVACHVTCKCREKCLNCIFALYQLAQNNTSCQQKHYFAKYLSFFQNRRVSICHIFHPQFQFTHLVLAGLLSCL